jgi:hypothetical protein
MSESPSDFALETLLEVARDSASSVPADLLRRLYKIQKLHQYDSGRDIAIQEMQRALEEHVTAVTEKGGV